MARALLCAATLFSGGVLASGCAVRAARSAPAPIQSANPRATVAAPPSATSQAVGPESPTMMVIQPDASLDERRDVDLWVQDAVSRSDQLSVALSAPAGPNCAAAREHLRAICDLAERICTIASRHPGDDDLESRCDESRERCAARTDEVQRRCGGT